MRGRKGRAAPGDVSSHLPAYSIRVPEGKLIVGALADSRAIPRSAEAGLLGGTIYAWWRGDAIPRLPPLSSFTAALAEDRQILGQLSGLDGRQVDARLRGGDVPYVAYLDGEPAAYGWSAWRHARIGELGIEFDLPEGNHYLWDFLTLPHLRGRGIYPRLLQEIFTIEKGEAERFWIGHDLENVASGKGIMKAGFRVAGAVHLQAGQPVLAPHGDRQRAAVAASILRIPLLGDA